MSNEDKWCFAWFAAARPTIGSDRAALEKSSKWQSGDIISVSFLDGTDAQKAWVKKFAAEWITDLANLQFSWQAPPSTDIRITFRYPGSWSVIGTTCKSIPKDKPTMNFGWLTPEVSDDEARRVVVHEFGHALGLIHEHQNPVASIQWNKPAVYHDLSGPPNNWDRATIDHNMFESYSLHDVAGTPVDWHSIMMYPIPASWTLNGMSAGLNTDLSDMDRSFIRQQYP